MAKRASHGVDRGDIAVPGSGESDKTVISHQPLERVRITAGHAFRQAEGLGDGQSHHLVKQRP